jgi:hypothetical protein
MSAEELWKTLTMRHRRQQICSALVGYGRIVSREPMTTSEHWLTPRTQQCRRTLPVSWRSAAVMMNWKPADDSKALLTDLQTA